MSYVIPSLISHIIYPICSHNESRYRRRIDCLYVCDHEDMMYGDRTHDMKDEDDLYMGYGYGHAPLSTQGQGQSFRAFQ